MANFEEAVRLTLQHEGGYVNNPHDKGGPTKYGITQADMPGVDIKNITPEQATAYYAEHYWKPLYSQINDQAVANKLFDCGVLMGVGTAVKLLQLVLANKIAVVSDGVFGQKTLDNLNQQTDVLPSYRTMLIQHFINIVNNNPNNSGFLQGWINRVNS